MPDYLTIKGFRNNEHTCFGALIDKIMKRIILLFIFVFGCQFSWGQGDQVDSLKNLLAHAKTDTMRLRILLLLVENIEEDQVWSVYNDQAYPIAEKLSKSKDEKENRIGLMGFSEVLSNKGYQTKRQGNINAALDFYSRSLKIKEAIADKNGIAAVLNNICFIYRQENDYAQALKYALRSLSIFQEIHDPQNTPTATNNVGLLYLDMGNFPKALDYFSESLKMFEQVNDKKRIATILNNIGNVYQRTGELEKALTFYQKSLEAHRVNGNQQGIGIAQNNMSAVYFLQGKHKLALAYSDSAIAINKQLGFPENIVQAEGLRAEIDSAARNFPGAFQHYKRYIFFRDSISNGDLRKKIVRTQMQYDFDKKSAGDSIRNVELKKQDDLKHDQEIQQQKLFTFGGIGGFALMLLLTLVSFRAYRNKQKANEIISHQKLLVEEKQKEILDSIYYARRIQKSLLPTEKFIQKNITRLKNKS